MTTNDAGEHAPQCGFKDGLPCICSASPPMVAGAQEPERIAAQLTQLEVGRNEAKAHLDRLGKWAETEMDVVKAKVAQLEAERDEAMRVLNPTCADETLVGAIHNLQQAALSERGNAEDAEKLFTAQTERIAQLEAERDQYRHWYERLMQTRMTGPEAKLAQATQALKESSVLREQMRETADEIDASHPKIAKLLRLGARTLRLALSALPHDTKLNLSDEWLTKRAAEEEGHDVSAGSASPHEDRT